MNRSTRTLIVVALAIMVAFPAVVLWLPERFGYQPGG